MAWAWVCGLIVAALIGVAWARRRQGRADQRIDVGAVSSDWLAKRRVNRDGLRP